MNKNILLTAVVVLLTSFTAASAAPVPELVVKSSYSLTTWDDLVDETNNVTSLDWWTDCYNYDPAGYTYSFKERHYDQAWENTYGYEADDTAYGFNAGDYGTVVPDYVTVYRMTNSNWGVYTSDANPSDPCPAAYCVERLTEYASFVSSDWPGQYSRQAGTTWKFRLTGDPTHYHTVIINLNLYRAPENSSGCDSSNWTYESDPTWYRIDLGTGSKYAFRSILGDGAWHDISLGCHSGWAYKGHYHMTATIGL